MSADAPHVEIRRLRSALHRAQEDADHLRQQLAYSARGDPAAAGAPDAAETGGAAAVTSRVTPAMEAGVSDHVWSLEEIAGLA